MENIFVLAIAVGVAIFIALPFFKDRFKEESEHEKNAIGAPLEEELKKLHTRKEALYTALKEFDFDYNMGKLSKEDYEELKSRYTAQAVGVLKEIDSMEQRAYVHDLDDEIEKEIRAVRGASLTDDEELEREILQARKSHVEKVSKLTCL
ncbi:MAG TPA: hypothetical protein VLB01_02330, partial [Thermodesulfobacteriota bacterium]|nr:hypothetical protein [Thermodesulfobacteriota bacterium]